MNEPAQQIAQVGDLPPIPAEVAQQIVDSAPFDYERLWIIAIAAALGLLYMHWGKVTFFGGLKRKKKRAVDDYLKTMTAAEDMLGGVSPAQAQIIRKLRDKADALDFAFDHVMGMLWLTSIPVGVVWGLLLDWAAWDADGLAISALGGGLGAAFSKYLYKWAWEPATELARRKFPWLFGKGKGPDDDDEGPPGLPRSGNRKEFKTSTFAG